MKKGYKCILAVVNNGFAEEAMEAAKACGALEHHLIERNVHIQSKVTGGCAGGVVDIVQLDRSINIGLLAEGLKTCGIHRTDRSLYIIRHMGAAIVVFGTIV